MPNDTSKLRAKVEALGREKPAFSGMWADGYAGAIHDVLRLLATPTDTDTAIPAGEDTFIAGINLAARIADHHAAPVSTPNEFTEGYVDAAQRIAANIREATEWGLKA